MSLSRIVAFVIGLVLAGTGLFLIINNLHDVWSLVVGGILLIVGLWVLVGYNITL